MEGRVDRLSERANRERLGEPRYALEQHVAAGEDADQQAVDHVVLADNAPRYLAGHVLDEL
jgi:hypothetical protein